jgi:hypothetical protein
MAKDTNELPGVSLDPVKPPFVGAHEESIKRGYELDPINVKPFVQFTVIMLILFVAVWVICSYTFDMTAEKWSPDGKKQVRTKYEGRVNPLAKEFNDRTVDERFARIDTHSPKANADGEKVYAPRLEAFKSRDFGGMPEYVRSSDKVTKDATNPPEYHPEDLLPSRNPILSAGEWDKTKKGAARLPIETVIANAKQLGLNDSIFKSQKGAKSEYDPTLYNPSSVLPHHGEAGHGSEKAGAKDAPHAPEKKDPAHEKEKK